MLCRLSQLLFFLFLSLLAGIAQVCSAENLRSDIETLSSFSSRHTGTPGAAQSADYIEDRFQELGFATDRYPFLVTVKKFGKATLRMDDADYPLTPFEYNVITPEATVGDIDGPLYYVGTGSLKELDHKQIEGAVILLDFHSGINWANIASLGAKAIIYLHDDIPDPNYFFEEKQELTPIQLPCFWMSRSKALQLFGPLHENFRKKLRERISVTAEVQWQQTSSDNIFALVPGTDDSLKHELVILEAFYDNKAFIPDHAPGADESISIATLLDIAEKFKNTPPARTVILAATSGHDQTLAGMRDLIWSINANSKEMRTDQRDLMNAIKNIKSQIKILKSLSFPLSADKERDRLIKKATSNSLSLEIDALSRRLMNLRLQTSSTETAEQIKTLAKKRFDLKQLSWAENYHNLPADDAALLKSLIPMAIKELKRQEDSNRAQLSTMKKALQFRQLVREYELQAIISLHLSGHGSGVGGFHQGWLYNLKPAINRTGIYSVISDVFEQSVSSGQFGKARYINSLRPSRLRNWDSWFLDKPFMGGEVSSMAGHLGLTLATTGDGRANWGTPWDTPDRLNWQWVTDQANLVNALINGVCSAAKLQNGNLPRDGFSTVRGRANLLLHGELFANYPAQGTTLLAYQGNGLFHTTVDGNGEFIFKGLADKKNVLDKFIIEGYRFDKDSGKVLWAIDKKSTGKDNYRLKMIRNNMKTDLIMFHARETTIFNLLEPRSLNHLTKLNLFDGRRDAPPQHFWYSRIDTRTSTFSSIYTDPGTRLKLTLSDTVLTNKFILSNGSKDKPMGTGYPVDTHPLISNTVFHAAQDAWSLILPRVQNLEDHGIFDQKINDLKNRGTATLQVSRSNLESHLYSLSEEKAAESLALAARVYQQVEKTQKDILIGVLFYIALFVPFAFTMERFLFSYANIYKRIAAFTGILLVLIAIIYQVHPAFKLAYSPMIVIIAFFIIGLSFMVSLIIFFRFEEEMLLLQRRATHKRPAEISHWKAFVAAFFLGVSNLRRRRLRTVLTCVTLIILTFTIMSFTTIKSSQKHNRLFFNSHVPYKGLMLKKVNWQSLPVQATDILLSHLQAVSTPAPRVWLEASEPTRTVQVPLRTDKAEIRIHGLIGLSAAENEVTGIDRLLTSGRWMMRDEKRVIILEENSAQELGVKAGQNDQVLLFGEPFTVIGTFAAQRFDQVHDLDGEPLTPVIFPDEAGTEISEVEQEAMESGDDVRTFQSRYQHIPALETAIIPASTLMAMGGNLKNIAIRPDEGQNISALADQLTDRFSLAIFAGDTDGVWLYNLSDTLLYSGVPNIIIPLLISTLIVLNTMISSVYERKSEIGVYTSVGLAPSHVSFLFVAEAVSLAVISVVLGYLFAQVSAALFSSTPYWAGITVNYSSLAGVAAMILVIGVVLLSVIYPSRVAANIAIPDVNRTFALPKAVDDRIQVILPFFMKYDEHESIGGFIYNYFLSHQDVSHGIFSTGELEVVFACETVEEVSILVEGKEPQCCQHITTKMWLAPFDFGIMQQVDIQFCPAPGMKNYLEIKATISRQAGEAGIWHRLNNTFLHALRKQLLVWRSIDDETHRQLSIEFRERLDNGNSTAGDKA